MVTSLLRPDVNRLLGPFYVLVLSSTFVPASPREPGIPTPGPGSQPEGGPLPTRVPSRVVLLFRTLRPVSGSEYVTPSPLPSCLPPSPSVPLCFLSIPPVCPLSSPSPIISTGTVGKVRRGRTGFGGEWRIQLLRPPLLLLLRGVVAVLRILEPMGRVCDPGQVQGDDVRQGPDPNPAPHLRVSAPVLFGRVFPSPPFQ